MIVINDNENSNSQPVIPEPNPNDPTGSIGNYVWLDSNKDGLQNEPPENGVNGVTVNLLDINGNLLQTTTTNDDNNENPGFYLFENIPDDLSTRYTLEFVAPQGFTFTTQNNDPRLFFDSDSPIDSDVDPNTGRVTIGPITRFLPEGIDQLVWDAGLVPVKSGTTGTPGDDKLIGTRRNDHISGGDGNDIIVGRGGNDTLSGDGGKDVIKGGAGKDVLDGGSGRDIIMGGGGNDTINGGRGKDRLVGGRGNDHITGGGGDDRINGGRGSDTLVGGAGHDEFLFTKGSSFRHGDVDVIEDFEIGADLIKLRGFGAIDPQQWFNRAVASGILSDSDQGVVLSPKTGGTLVIEDVHLDQLSGDNFHLL
ncbi:SdrD B-like domain-containing protein [Moorena sp. SIO4G3]|uniref:SdrD B-like domain-containing protein n=1 Tax=Moorena sp. SIO4G3 TaxID=2607821 RepID=UPI0025F45F13|nr:SdrD B-like domain-containing protein [Moorena sp. SIO4G3]